MTKKKMTREQELEPENELLRALEMNIPYLRKNKTYESFTNSEYSSS
ncbi:hypothetical protein [Enterococcus termitis]|nr:hypothetical protein [Enterococcus termitis]OJG99453.1 hypothetical protein RV18_GL001521 [Enterococcus termitis]